MERREVLKLGALTGAALSSGCATTRAQDASAPAGTSLAEVRAFVERLDGTMAAMDARPGLHDALPGSRRPSTEEANNGDALARKSIRSLFLAGSFSDLAEDARTHPAVQDRIWAGLPEMDDATIGMSRLLEQMTSTERSDLSRALRRDPDAPMRVVGAIDREAHLCGVSAQRRIHLRAIAAHTAARMKQSSSMLFDEYVTKFHKLSAQSGEIAEVERRMAAAMGASAFQGLRERTLASSMRWAAEDPSGTFGAEPGSTPRTVTSTPAARPVVVPARGLRMNPDGTWADEAPEPENDLSMPGHVFMQRRRGNTYMTVGGVLLGIGVIGMAVSAAVIAGGSEFGGAIGGAFGLTAGAVLLLSGLITLIIGVAIR